MIDTVPEQILSETAELRRNIHAHPELGGTETLTPEAIASVLSRNGIQVRRNVGKNGLTAEISGAKPGKIAAIRADFDALPITEPEGLPFVSQFKGKMHACGHDAHAAMAVGAALLLRQAGVPAGGVRFIFQPSEEIAPDGGAKYMVQDGAMDGVSAVFAQHVMPELETGRIGFIKGVASAYTDSFRGVIRGVSVHASQPQNGVDALLTGAQFVQAAQTVVSRSISPFESAVVNIGTFSSGSAENIIASEAKLKGTVRSFSEDVRVEAQNRLTELMDGICASNGAVGELKYVRCFNSVVNSPDMIDLGEDVAAQLFGKSCIAGLKHPLTAGEDFSCFLGKAPGAMFFLGCSKPGEEHGAPLHSPAFMIDEDCLKIGVLFLANVALAALEKLG